jgi:site-specific recombinase XerD
LKNYGAATTPSPPSRFTSRRSSISVGTSIIRPISLVLEAGPNTVTQRLAALRFFYVQVLKSGWSVAETPYPKKVLHLPEILSQEEVARLIDAAEFPFHRIVLLTLYATGARRAEMAHLKISDIVSQRMVIHIRGGKGRKDRDVMLSPKLLDALRVYWRGLKRKPTDWLFPGNRWHTASHPVSTKVLWHACQQAAERAGLEHKHIHPHTLRHCFATHLLEAGASDTALRLMRRNPACTSSTTCQSLPSGGSLPPLWIAITVNKTFSLKFKAGYLIPH